MAMDRDALASRWWELVLDPATSAVRLEIGSYREANELFWITGASKAARSPLCEFDLWRAAPFGVLGHVYGFAVAALQGQVEVAADFLADWDEKRIAREVASRLDEGWDLDARTSEDFLHRVIRDLQGFYSAAAAKSRCLVHVSTVPSPPAALSFIEV